MSLKTEKRPLQKEKIRKRRRSDDEEFEIIAKQTRMEGQAQQCNIDAGPEINIDSSEVSAESKYIYFVKRRVSDLEKELATKDDLINKLKGEAINNKNKVLELKRLLANNWKVESTDDTSMGNICPDARKNVNRSKTTINPARIDYFTNTHTEYTLEPKFLKVVRTIVGIDSKQTDFTNEEVTNLFLFSPI